jgi:glycosyltransferase involved in cell wall biosynthesis
VNKLTLVCVTSAYNETLNLEELHRRCRLAWQSLAKDMKSETGQELGFRMVIADNHSSDDSLTTLQSIIARDPGVMGIANAANYGPDASFANVLRQARDCDLMALLNRMNYGAEASAGVPRPSNRWGSPLAGQTSTACS